MTGSSVHECGRDVAVRTKTLPRLRFPRAHRGSTALIRAALEHGDLHPAAVIHRHGAQTLRRPTEAPRPDVAILGG